MAPSPALIGVIAAVAWFSGFVAAHVVGWRAGRSNARWLSTSYMISAFGTLVTVTGLTAGSETIATVLLAVLLALMTSACLVILYVPAVYTVLTSLSVQTMIVLRRSGGAVPEAKLYDHFANRPIVEGRLATLVASGYLAADGSRFRLTSRGRRVAKIFAFIKEFWKLGAGG
jgi:hypothetical protein